MNPIFNLLYKIRNKVLATLGYKTVGARALVIRKDEVLLIRHTYQKGWYTIGGTVDKGESPLQTVIRELYEEVGVKVLDKPKLFGVYHHKMHGRDDYVILYLVTDFSMEEVTSPEVAEKKWFKLTNLPADVTPSTKKRIEEYQETLSQSDHW